MEEQKDNKLELDTLRKEVKTLRTKCLNVSDYNEWDIDSIVLWISQLNNGKYKKYCDGLRSALKEEELTGSDLGDIEESNLKDWGVKNFRDRKDMLKEIKRLTSGQKGPGHEQIQAQGLAPPAYGQPVVNEGGQTEYH